MPRPALGPLVNLLLQGTLAFVLLSAGLQKWAEGPARVAVTLEALEWFPPFVSIYLARALVLAEVGLGIWLVTGWSPQAAALSAGVLFGVFTLALVQLGASVGWDRPCGCAAHWLGEDSIRVGVVRNIVLLGASGVIWARSGRKRTARQVASDRDRMTSPTRDHGHARTLGN